MVFGFNNDKSKVDMLNFFYPVGSYYETSDTSFNPNSVWGGTWELELEGQVHISAGTNYEINGALSNTTDGGEATHTLTTTEMPAHTHNSKSLTGSFAAYRWDNGSNSGIFTVTGNNKNMKSPGAGTAISHTSYSVNATHTHDSIGGNGAHNNMQPYIVVNRWHRTA